VRAVIKGKRVTLRKLRMSDADKITEYCQDPLIPRWTRVPTPYTKKHAVKFIKDSIKKWKTGSYNMAVEHKGKLVGTVSLTKKDFDRAEIGWWTGKQHRGQGFATESAKLLIKQGFNKLKLNKIYAHFKEGNKKSERVMQKAGMKYECLLREDVKYKGKYYDAIQYCILKREYKK